RIGRRLLVDRRVCPLGVLAELRGRRELLDLEHRLELLLEAPDGLAHPQSSSTIVLRCSRVWQDPAGIAAGSSSAGSGPLLGALQVEGLRGDVASDVDTAGEAADLA